MEKGKGQVVNRVADRMKCSEGWIATVIVMVMAMVTKADGSGVGGSV